MYPHVSDVRFAIGARRIYFITYYPIAITGCKKKKNYFLLFFSNSEYLLSSIHIHYILQGSITSLNPVIVRFSRFQIYVFP
jgi:hypothetical protein